MVVAWRVPGWRSAWRREITEPQRREDQLCVSAKTCGNRLLDASKNRTLPRKGTKSTNDYALRACAWTAVMAIASTMSRAVQPRERSFEGLSRPWRIGPMAV